MSTMVTLVLLWFVVNPDGRGRPIWDSPLLDGNHECLVGEHGGLRLVVSVPKQPKAEKKTDVTCYLFFTPNHDQWVLTSFACLNVTYWGQNGRRIREERVTIVLDDTFVTNQAGMVAQDAVLIVPAKTTHVSAQFCKSNLATGKGRIKVKEN
jgi:hypothetical protein